MGAPWWTAAAILLGGVLAAAPAPAALRPADLAAPRTVSERNWLDLRLQVLGLSLSYPAYRVSVGLTDSSRVQFEFWISTPMAQHLADAGREETERVLTYHAHGIQQRVADLLQREFPALAATYDGDADFGGQFMTPGKELEDPPERWARWATGDLQWSWRP